MTWQSCLAGIHFVFENLLLNERKRESYKFHQIRVVYQKQKMSVSLYVRGFAKTAQQLVPRATAVKQYSTQHHEESPDEFDQRFVKFFSQPNLDGWWIRKGLTELQHHDVIPEPKIIAAALRAIRRVNDLGLAIRFLEAMRIKCGPPSLQKQIYPYLIQEVKPVLDELGIPTPEDLGYDKPEKWKPLTSWWEDRFDEDCPSYHKKTGIFAPNALDPALGSRDYGGH